MSTVRAVTEGAPQTYASTPAQMTIGTNAVTILLPNPLRKCVLIQNTGATILKFNFGTVSPTATVYHYALAAGGGADDGTGGVYIDENWTGAITMISSGMGGTFVLTEIQTGSPNWAAAYTLGNPVA